jgi:hypothetical protein
MGLMASTPVERRAVIGIDMPWEAVEGVIFRARDFTPYAARLKGEKVVAPPLPNPYGALLVDGPGFPAPIQMPVNHRVDYLNFLDIYGGVSPVAADQELLVSYLPYRGFLGPVFRLLGMPFLHVRGWHKMSLDELFSHLPSDNPRERRTRAKELIVSVRCVRCGRKALSFNTRCVHCHVPLL